MAECFAIPEQGWKKPSEAEGVFGNARPREPALHENESTVARLQQCCDIHLANRQTFGIGDIVHAVVCGSEIQAIAAIDKAGDRRDWQSRNAFFRFGMYQPRLQTDILPLSKYPGNVTYREWRVHV